MARSPRSLLVISHPGHELRVYGWVKRVCPRVLIITDGSGARGFSRIEASERLLASLGAEVCAPRAPLRDTEAYAAMMAGDVQRFVELARTVHHLLCEGEVDLVAGDAREGYNPMHDVCRAIIDAAVERRASEGVSVVNRDFALAAAERPAPDAADGDAWMLCLDDGELAEKIEAARAYAALEAEVAAQRAQLGDEAFRWECLRLRRAGEVIDEPPYYESFGERRVREGLYTQVLRHRTHVRPIEQALHAWAREGRAI